ncbi:MAG: ABC transporter substrate-binding protein [Candidatus Sungiibacteriota bacterium]
MHKFILSLVGLALVILTAFILRYYRAAPFFAVQKEKVYQIGILVRGSGYEAAVAGYRRKMSELGYTEGKNIVYDVRFVSAKEDIALAVQDFLRIGVDLIHTYSTPATQAAYQATKDMPHPVPIVFGSVGDPLLAGVVRDFGHPGTNVTGVSSLSTELTARRLELLREINPAIQRIAMPHTASENKDLAADKSVEIVKDTALKLGMTMIFFPVLTREDNDIAAKLILQKNIDGIIVGGDSLVWGSIDAYIATAIHEKIPFVAFDLSQVQKGALIGFGPDYAISGEQSAIITNQILRGKPPAEIPVQVPRKLLLVVNQKTARAIGIVIPRIVIDKADRIIDE